MAFKMKWHSLPGIKQREAALKPGVPMMGSFIDGERVTYAEARKAEMNPDFKGQVVHTNKEAEDASREDALRAIKDGKQKETITGQDGVTHTNPGLNLKEAQANMFQNTKDKEKIDKDRAAQDILEDATKAKNNANLHKSTNGKEGVGPKVAGEYNKDGFRGSSARIAEKQRILEDNKYLNAEGGIVDGVETQYSRKANENKEKIMGFKEIQNKKEEERKANSAKNSQTNTPKVYPTGKKGGKHGQIPTWTGDRP
jgi:hypothetical protein